MTTVEATRPFDGQPKEALFEEQVCPGLPSLFASLVYSYFCKLAETEKSKV